jgi:hypothetical protein
MSDPTESRETNAMHGPRASRSTPHCGLRIRLLAVVVAALFGASGCAAMKEIPFVPLQVNLVPRLQIFPSEVPVYGLGLNGLYGIQDEVIGLNVGVYNQIDKNLEGVALGAVNVGGEKATGLMLAMGNAVTGDFRGLQLAGVNQIEGNLTGAQLGVGNVTVRGSGLQLGVVNYAESMKGLQIGLLNYNGKGLLPFLPFFNWGN